MFYQRSSVGLRAIFFLILSITLLLLGQHVSRFRDYRAHISSSIAYPFQWLVDTPVRFTHSLLTGITARQQLIDENARLQMQSILLQARLQRLLKFEKENAELRALLQSTPKISGRVVVARLLSVALDPHLQQAVLDHGSKQHTYVGQPVLDAFGVMGQVIGVGPLTSDVMLITDKQSAVPVEDYRTGARAVAVGLGVSGRLKLINVPLKNQIQAGDLFVTSGLGLRYPVGYPVGVVENIHSLLLTPTAHLDETQQVLLAWPNKEQFKRVAKT